MILLCCECVFVFVFVFYVWKETALLEIMDFSHVMKLIIVMMTKLKLQNNISGDTKKTFRIKFLPPAETKSISICSIAIMALVCCVSSFGL